MQNQKKRTKLLSLEFDLYRLDNDLELMIARVMLQRPDKRVL